MEANQVNIRRGTPLDLKSLNSMIREEKLSNLLTHKPPSLTTHSVVEGSFIVFPWNQEF